MRTAVVGVRVCLPHRCARSDIHPSDTRTPFSLLSRRAPARPPPAPLRRLAFSLAHILSAFPLSLGDTRPSGKSGRGRHNPPPQWRPGKERNKEDCCGTHSLSVCLLHLAQSTFPLVPPSAVLALDIWLWCLASSTAVTALFDFAFRCSLVTLSRSQRAPTPFAQADG